MLTLTTPMALEGVAAVPPPQPPSAKIKMQTMKIEVANKAVPGVFANRFTGEFTFSS